MHSQSMLRLIGPLAVVFTLAAGCERVEYDLTRPADLASHIGTKADLVVKRDPLEYRFIAYESRLIARIYNSSDDPIELLGPQSSVVDPHGQSHPLRGQSIAAHSFIKLILPPLRPHLERSGPSIGIGFGLIGRAERHRDLGDPVLDQDEPRFFDVVDDDALYWDWDGETDVRILFAFQQGERRFTQEFVVHRKKL